MQKDIRGNHKTIIKTILRRLLGMSLYETVMMTWHLGYVPHIKHPRSFNEKIAHRKIHSWREIPHKLADKYAVRKFVAKTIGKQYLNKLYGVYDNADEIDFAKLPESFVIKGTHGSNMNIIIRNQQDFDEKAIHESCRTFLREKYGWICNELHYSNIPPRLIIEKFLHDKEFGIPLDYKFFVFHGRVEFVQVDFDRFSNHSRSIFDRNWQQQVFGFQYPIGRFTEAPRLLGKMISLSEQLSSGFDFIRIDFYSPDNESIIFGEMTFAPGSGWEFFMPERKYDFEMGKLWRIQ
jgi:hypothetical protein